MAYIEVAKYPHSGKTKVHHFRTPLAAVLFNESCQNAGIESRLSTEARDPASITYGYTEQDMLDIQRGRP